MFYSCTNYRTLEQHYPHPATENDYMKSLVNATEDNNCSYTHLFALNLFTLEQKKLQVGGALLPDLMEFYKWIHTQLSHLMTYERAKQITIGQVINLTAKRYSSEICDHLTSLFKRINSKNKLIYICLYIQQTTNPLDSLCTGTNICTYMHAHTHVYTNTCIHKCSYKAALQD